MTTDELRAKFEAWWVYHFRDGNGPPPSRRLSGTGIYTVEVDEILWTTWQAAHTSRDAEVDALREASTNSKINTHKFLYSKGLGNGSLRVCDCFDSTSIECLGLSSDIEFLEKLLSLAKKYEESK